MKDLSKLMLLSAFAITLSSCQTTKVEKTKDIKPTFSVYTGKVDPLSCNVQGEMENCEVDWTVNAGILTHRQICNSKNRDYMGPMLNAMARTLSSSCELKIKYARLTTKDDVQQEQRLAKMMSQSKLWNKYSVSTSRPGEKSKSISEFPEKFIKKVVEVKGLFSELSEALNSVGYDFVIDGVEVTKLEPLTESRHFQTLKTVKANNKFIVPENIRIVWLNRDFKNARNLNSRNIRRSAAGSKTMPNRLPSKSSIN